MFHYAQCYSATDKDVHNSDALSEYYPAHNTFHRAMYHHKGTISITLTGQGKHVRLEESGYLQGLHEVMQPKRGGDHHD